jgi:hypothetical protein
MWDDVGIGKGNILYNICFDLQQLHPVHMISRYI